MIALLSLLVALPAQIGQLQKPSPVPPAHRSVPAEALRVAQWCRLDAPGRDTLFRGEFQMPGSLWVQAWLQRGGATDWFASTGRDLCGVGPIIRARWDRFPGALELARNVPGCTRSFQVRGDAGLAHLETISAYDWGGNLLGSAEVGPPMRDGMAAADSSWAWARIAERTDIAPCRIAGIDDSVLRRLSPSTFEAARDDARNRADSLAAAREEEVRDSIREIQRQEIAQTIAEQEQREDSLVASYRLLSGWVRNRDRFGQYDYAERVFVRAQDVSIAGLLRLSDRWSKVAISVTTRHGVLAIPDEPWGTIAVIYRGGGTASCALIPRGATALTFDLEDQEILSRPVSEIRVALRGQAPIERRLTQAQSNALSLSTAYRQHLAGALHRRWPPQPARDR